MPVQNRLGGGFQLLRLLRELGARAAAMLRCVAGQLDPIDRQHLAPDQSLAITHREHRRKDLGDFIAQRAHEVGNRREMRRGHAAQGHERHVFLAQALDRPAAHDTLGVRKQHHLEQHRRRVRGRARCIVPEPGVKVRQIDFVVEQVVERVLERARQQLAGEVDRDELRVRVQRLVSGHGAVLDSGGVVAQIAVGRHPLTLQVSFRTTPPYRGFPTASLDGHSRDCQRPRTRRPMIYLKDLNSKSIVPAWDPSRARAELTFAPRMHGRTRTALESAEGCRVAADTAASAITQTHSLGALNPQFVNKLLAYCHNAIQGCGYELEVMHGVSRLLTEGGRNIMLVLGCQTLQLLHARVDAALGALRALPDHFQVVFAGSNPTGGAGPSAITNEAKEMRSYFDSCLQRDTNGLITRLGLEQWVEPESADTKGNVRQFLGSPVLDTNEPKRVFLVSSTFHLMRIAVEIEAHVGALRDKQVTQLVLLGSEDIYDQAPTKLLPEYVKSLAFEVFFDMLKSSGTQASAP